MTVDEIIEKVAELPDSDIACWYYNHSEDKGWRSVDSINTDDLKLLANHAKALLACPFIRLNYGNGWILETNDDTDSRPYYTMRVGRVETVEYHDTLDEALQAISRIKEGR
jgi:hypothetical protein